MNRKLSVLLATIGGLASVILTLGALSASANAASETSIDAYVYYETIGYHGGGAEGVRVHLADDDGEVANGPTGPDGHAIWYSRPAGNYKVWIDSPTGYEPTPVVSFTLAWGETEEIVFPLEQESPPEPVTYTCNLPLVGRAGGCILGEPTEPVINTQDLGGGVWELEILFCHRADKFLIKSGGLEFLNFNPPPSEWDDNRPVWDPPPASGKITVKLEKETGYHTPWFGAWLLKGESLLTTYWTHPNSLDRIQIGWPRKVVVGQHYPL